MKYLVSIIFFFFSFQVNAEDIKIFHTPLICKNLEWMMYKMYSGLGFGPLENSKTKKAYCETARLKCKKHIESTEADLELRFSSAIGYGFTFHKPFCEDGVDYYKAAEYYVTALKLKKSNIPNNSSNPPNLFHPMIKLVEDAARNLVSKKELSNLLEILQLLILNYGSEDYDYDKHESFVEHLWLGENVVPISFTLNWLKRASECGWGKAQYSLGRTLLMGTLRGAGRKQTVLNYVEGYKWLLIAQQTGYPVLESYFDFAEEKLSSQQITEAQDRAYNWQESCPLI